MRFRLRGLWRLCRAAFLFLLPPAVPVVLMHVLGALRVAFAFRFPLLFLGTFVFALAWRWRRRGGPLRAALPHERQLAMARIDSPGKLRAVAPVAVGAAALFSYPAAFLTTTVTGFFGPTGGGVPPAADAWWQLSIVAVAAAAAVVAIDRLFGSGTCFRAVAGDGVPAVLLAVTLGAAVTPPLLILGRVDARTAWLAVMWVQLCWPIAAFIAGGFMSEARTKRLSPPPPPPSPRPSPDSWFTKYGIETNHDVVLVSPGVRKIPVIIEVRRLTGMGLKEAKDLIDTTPGLVMTRVTSERAGRAREVLESLGATVTVSEDPARS